ncbi:hypothetical protein MBEHAL_0623 [Halarchaeum acidiphilum MH1-52-1]|uniref:Uncharacterized protein n=1 Tax=Halarchaeum acidiphilum MH1-52-1 TaxID=1261545 RepID=U3AAT9_9EURY|nr:hypothetical protein [Halarchaeum acidiphilum]GAD51863.1 hypothetical protein MBEHAL_0623 [Halarchaeum acidiphilum MH1-52-1]
MAFLDVDLRRVTTTIRSSWATTERIVGRSLRDALDPLLYSHTEAEGRAV